NPSHNIPNAEGLYPKGVVRATTGAWVGHVKSWRATWVQGLGSVVDTPYGLDGTFGATVGWRIDRAFSLRGVVSRSMRLPTFTDLFYSVATYHPNDALKPETAMTYRLTGDWVSWRALGSHGGEFKAEASVWYRATKDVIDWEQRPDLTPGDGEDQTGHWWSTQSNRLGTVGAELSASYTSRGWLRVAMLGYGYMNSDMSVATNYISKYALDYMRHKASAVVGVAFLRDFTLTLTGSFYDREGSYIDVGGKQRGYNPYFLLDGRLAWEPRIEGRTGLQLYLDATNITGTEYFDFGGLPMPRQWASGGVVLTF
ncbi:MAG: TonB-dependent receptor, partial [Alistipes sp.]|nr:TonB-dependent receptor [Alistipes sp.]